jgi:hypothetical protein
VWIALGVMQCKAQFTDFQTCSPKLLDLFHSSPTEGLIQPKVLRIKLYVLKERLDDDRRCG